MNNDEINNINNHNKLLLAWQKSFPSSVSFNRDGIISTEHWERSNVKVLFVLKETNQAEQDLTKAIFNALKNEKSGWWRGKVLLRVGRWAYGLLHYSGKNLSFEDANVSEHRKSAILNIAYINMRKTSGGAKTNKKSFSAHVKEYAPYIKRQIELINPDIVVLGGTFKPLKKHIFPELKKVSRRIHKYNNMVFINVHHPAARTKARRLYEQVMNNYHNYKNVVIKK